MLSCHNLRVNLVGEGEERILMRIYLILKYNLFKGKLIEAGMPSIIVGLVKCNSKFWNECVLMFLLLTSY